MKLWIGAALAAAHVTVAAAQAEPPAPVQDPLQPLLEELEFSGNILVARDGEVLRRETRSPAALPGASELTAETPFAIASMTKSFTAALVLELVDEGRFALDDTLAELLPAFDVPYAGQVTVRHLLQNRSGIPHYISIPGWFDPEVTSAYTTASFLETLRELELAFPPGSDYLYSNVNYYLLARIIDRHSGAAYEDYLQRRILDPLGLHHTGQIYEPDLSLATNLLRTDDGNYAILAIANPPLFRGTASMYSTIDDLMLWGQAVMEGEVYSEAAAAEAFDPETPMAWDRGQIPLGGDTPADALFYNGRLIGYLSLIVLLPEHDGVIIVLNNNTAGYANMLSIAGTLALQHFSD